MVGYWDRDLRCEFANAAYLEWFGLPPEKVIGRKLVELQGEDLFRLNEPHARLALNGHAQHFEREIRKADGSVGHADAHYIPDRDEEGEVRGFFVLVNDVTELHQAYARVRELAQRLESAREDERRLVANALHEGMAQDLFGCTLALDYLKSKMERGEDAQAAANEAKALIEKCIARTRQIARELHPLAMSHLSLMASIEGHARFVEEFSAIRIHLTEIAPFPILDENIGLMFFRAAQEAITNVVHHAQAKNIGIVLRTDNNTDTEAVTMEITDDGIGIPDSALIKRGSLGLLGIRERFGAIGGELTVERSAPTGTKLMVRLPIPIRRSMGQWTT